MKTRRGARSFWLKRFMAPMAGLNRHLLLSSVGLLVLLVGGIISFGTIFRPAVNSVAAAWNQWLSGLVGFENLEMANHLLGGFLLLAGGYTSYRGIRSLMRRVVEVVSPRRQTSGVADVFRRRQQLAQGPKIVAIGGGTGLSTVLRGLKQHSSNVTAIVTVTDDGGSSGRLVKDLGILPPGDLRACLVALADAEKMMTDLFQHRFTQSSGALSGHSLGNLLLAGLVDQAAGDMDRALELASEVLAIRGRVVPSTNDLVRLRALMEDGSEIWGETAIVSAHKRIRRLFLAPENPAPHPTALEAIRDADIICIGPGSVYTSIIPNLLVPGIAEAIRAASCPKVYICNVMTQAGESESFTAAEHLVAIEANVPTRVFDYVMVNSGVPTQQTLDRYRGYDQELVAPDLDRVRTMGFKPVPGNYMSETDYVRHDPVRVASKIMEILLR